MNEYVEYRNSLCSLKNILGLGCLHLYNKEELLPYISRILSKINEWLILEDKEDLSENVKLFVEYYEDGLNKLIEPGRIGELLQDYDYTREDPGFVQRYFVISWTNVFSTIYLELLYNYSYLFTETPIDCHECCGSIEKDEDGNLVYNSNSGNLSSQYISCGCGK